MERLVRELLQRERSRAFHKIVGLRAEMREYPQDSEMLQMRVSEEYRFIRSIERELDAAEEGYYGNAASKSRKTA